MLLSLLAVRRWCCCCCWRQRRRLASFAVVVFEPIEFCARIFGVSLECVTAYKIERTQKLTASIRPTTAPMAWKKCRFCATVTKLISIWNECCARTVCVCLVVWQCQAPTHIVSCRKCSRMCAAVLHPSSTRFANYSKANLRVAANTMQVRTLLITRFLLFIRRSVVIAWNDIICESRSAYDLRVD